jgi:hypothetical protein
MTAADVRRPEPRAPEEAEPNQNLTLALWALGVTLLVVGGPLLGYLLGHTDPPPGPAQARSAALTLEHDAAWRPGRAGIAGLALAQPVTLRRADGTKLAAGRLAAYDAGFDPVPPALRRRFSGRTADATIRLGSWTAVRHAVSLGGRDRLWLALVPDTKGWVAVACEGAAAAATCPGIAASLQVKDAKPVAPGPDERVATAISGAIADLNRARKSATVALRSPSVAARAHAARRVAAAHGRIATALTKLAVRPQERRLVTALARAVRAQLPNLDDLGRATVRRRQTDYNAARNAIRRQEGRVRSALRRLRSIGYDTT